MNAKITARARAKRKSKRPSANPTFPPSNFQWPTFDSPQALKAWLDTLPREEAEVDLRLKTRLPVELHLHQLMIEGFDYLAKQQGMKSGRELMYLVLSQYLSSHLPEDF
ncbi:MAG: hypothetical protein ACREOO_15715 [bacterium]